MAKACRGGCETDARGAACDDAGLGMADVKDWDRCKVAEGGKTHLASEKGCHARSDCEGNDIRNNDNVPECQGRT